MIGFTYLNKPPAKYTFQPRKLQSWVKEWCGDYVLNLFAGKTRFLTNEIRVDIDSSVNPDYCMDAKEFLRMWILEQYQLFDTVILDPPFNIRKSREKYDGRWIGKYRYIKDLIPYVLVLGGRVLSFGYDTVGLSASRGFKKLHVCVICHGGDHNDTLVVVEELIQPPLAEGKRD